MLIDNEKFVALLAENSGIEQEKVEKYLKELIDDIRNAFDEDEGYEVDGFGIFSKLGSNILFIPSEELETEINYKYVGMEPIELPGGVVEESSVDEEEAENPIQGILDGGESEEETNEYEDPFAELFNEAEEYENRSKEEDQQVEEDIEAAVEEEIENENLEEEIFNEISEEQEDEKETPLLVDEEIEESTEQEHENKSTEEDLEKESEEKTGPEQWGIDAHKEEDNEDAFSGLFGDDTAESTELIDEEDIFAFEETEEEEELAESKDEDTQEEEIDFSALEEDSDEVMADDFDDPFAELEKESEEEEDFVPVVTNVSSESASKSKTKEENEEDTPEKEGEEKESKNEKKPINTLERKQRSPVFLYMLLALVVLGGTGYLLAYFGIFDVNGITPPKYKKQAVATPPVNQPTSTPPQINEASEEQAPVNTLLEVAEENTGTSTSENPELPSEEDNLTNENSSQEAEQQRPEITEENDLAPLVADEKSPGNQGIISPVGTEAGEGDVYGLTGSASTKGNNGYTIVLYTLSRKAGADAQFEKLTQDGYRTIIKEKPSEQYGVLYRVSIGQFESLADAAIAAEKIDSDILGNYIITKI